MAEYSIKDLEQLVAVNETLLSCGRAIAGKSDDLSALQKELSQVWEDGKGEEFKEVINSLLQLNGEALEQLANEIGKLSDYIEKVRIALGVEIKQ